MSITKITASIRGLKVKKLILNEAKTVILGQVQNKNSKLEFISTKWIIDKKTKVAKCVLEDTDYDLSLEGIIIGLAEAPKVKSFYTFKKDAWHCKLYKWVFGKEPHKVHPTMCPYFWIMVCVFLVFPLILVVKLFGKAGTSFMERCSTFQARRKAEKERVAKEKKDSWLTKIAEGWEKMTDEEAYKLMKSNEWDKWKYSLSYKIEIGVENKYLKHWQVLRDAQVARDHANYLIQLEKDKEREAKRKEREALRPKKVARKAREFNINSKTAKIIGIGLIILGVGASLYGFLLAMVALVNLINWFYVVMVAVYLVGTVVGCIVVYQLIIHVIVPLIKHVVYPFFDLLGKGCVLIYSKVIVPIFNYGVVLPVKYLLFIPVKYCVVKPFVSGAEYVGEADYTWLKNIVSGVEMVLTFLWRVITFPFIALYKGFIYAIEFFKMCKDLIYNMYKKNCPVITWTESEESNEINFNK